MNSVSNDDRQAHPPTLVGATVLQIVPALREEPVARTALDVAAALRQAGARALVAAEEGPLVGELTAKRGRSLDRQLGGGADPGGAGHHAVRRASRLRAARLLGRRVHA